MSNLKFISTGSTTVTLSGNGLSNSFTANGSAYTLGTAISLADGEYVEFAGSTNDFSKDGSHYYQFSIGGTGTVEVEGDLISLTNNNAFVKQYQFVNLFKDCSKITSIANLNFPASIADFCYSNMFAHCTSLVNGGTTLPATSVSRWCYNGMFTDCSSMTTPPTILATKIAPFCYYQMFAGCTSLTEGPTLNNFTVEGRMNSNCMFKGCSNLSTIQVNFRDWPAEANINQSRKWLEGVSQTGLFVKPNVLATIPTGVIPAGWTLSSIYGAQIIVADQTYSFNAMSETDQTKIFGFSYVGGDETLNINVDTTNLPSWLTYTTDSDSIDFSANGYQIDSSTTVQIPITFSAADAETKNVVATFNISNYPTATITVNTIPTFTFDAQSETDIVSSLMTYATGSNSISCQIEGELPAGLSCVDGIITGVPTDFTGNYSGSFDVVYSASDARNVSSSFDLEIINATPDYANMPFTISAIQNATVSFTSKNADASNITYTKTSNGVTTTGTCGSSISLAAGDIISFEGPVVQTTYSSKLYNFSASNGNIAMYGNIGSLIGYDRTIRQYNFHEFFKNQTKIVDFSNLYFNVDEIQYRGCHDMFASCSNITGSMPHFLAQTYGIYACWATFVGCTNLTSINGIPATTVDKSSFVALYINDSKIAEAKFALPSNITLTYETYQSMLEGCSSLKVGPIIGSGYTFSNVGSNGPFKTFYYNCSSLSAIQVQFTNWVNSNYFYNWVNGVNGTGVFIVPQDWEGGTSRGSNAIPSNFKILKRMNSDHSLQFAEATTWNGVSYAVGDTFPDADPYAWYYGT